MNFQDQPPRSRRDELDRDLRRIPLPELKRRFEWARAHWHGSAWPLAREIDRREALTWNIYAEIVRGMTRPGEGER